VHTKNINKFFTRYLDAFKRYDHTGVADCYQLPCTLHTPDKVVLLKETTDCQQEFDDIFKQLKQANVSNIIAKKASYSVVNQTLLIACVSWEFVDDKGVIFADFCAIYHLVVVNSELKIINVVSHDLSNTLELDYSFELTD
jgi:hypothetical protein